MNREDLVYIVKKVRREVEKRNRNMLDGNIGNNTLDEYLEKVAHTFMVYVRVYHICVTI